MSSSASSAELADRLVTASVLLTRWLRAADPSPRLSGPQASALAVIVHAGRIRMSDLARLEEVAKPTVTRVAGELEALGLISRRSDADDRRVSWLEATARGRRVLAEGQARRIAPLAQALGTLDEQGQAALAAGVETLEGMLAEALGRGPAT